MEAKCVNEVRLCHKRRRTQHNDHSHLLYELYGTVQCRQHGLSFRFRFLAPSQL